MKQILHGISSTLARIILSLLLLLVVGVGNAWGETYTYDFSGVKNSAETLWFSDVNLKTAAGCYTSSNKGTTETKYYYKNGDEFTFNADNGYYFSAQTTTTSSYFILGKSGAYVVLPTYANEKITSIKITGSTGHSTKVSANIYTISGTAASTAQTWSTTGQDHTYAVGSDYQNSQLRFQVTNSNNIQFTKIEVTTEATQTSGPTAPTISLAAGTYKGTQTTTITIPDDANVVLYTTDGTDPTDINNNPESITSNTDVTISSSCTLRAVSSDNLDNPTYSTEVSREYVIKKSIDNTPETAYTIAEAIAKANDSGNWLDDPVYVKGTVSAITTAWSDTYNNATYAISEDGTTTSTQFLLYRCATNNVSVGDDVIACGTLSTYSGAVQMAAGNTIVAQTKAATLSIANIAVAMGGTITPVITTNISGEYLVEYTSDNANVVIADGDELATGDETGTANITATIVADGYKTTQTTFTVTVTSAATLSSITVGGDLTKSTYTLGDEFSFEGLTATGNYSDETTADLTSTITWSVEPATLTATTTSVIVKATSGEISGTKEYTVTVNKKTASITIADMEIGKNATDVAISATTTPENAALTYEITEGSNYITLTDGKISAVAPGTATVKATYAGNDEYASAETTFTVTVIDATVAEVTSFSATSGNINDDVTYEAQKGNSSTAPAVYNNNLRLYQNGGYVVVKGVKGVKIQSVTLTTSATYASTTVGYAVDGGDAPTTGETVATSSDYTISSLDNNEVDIYCLGTDKNSRLEIASIAVTYTKADIALSSIAVSGDYKTQFDLNDTFTHENAVVTATYSDESTADVTANATFSTPDMTTEGDKTITVTYKEGSKEVSATYTINVKGFTPATDGYETVDFTSVYSEVTSSQAVGTYKGTSFKLVASQNTHKTSEPTYYASSTAVRAYESNTVTITGAEAIKNVVVNYVDGYVDEAATPTGLDTKTAVVTFSKTCRFTSITVFYKDVKEISTDFTSADPTTSKATIEALATTAKGTNTLIYAPKGSEATGENVVIKQSDDSYTCANFVLTDQVKVAIPTGFSADKITYERKTNDAVTTLGVGKYATIYVPYVFDPGNFKVLEFDNYKDNVVNFKYAGTVDNPIKANTPYIIRPNNGTDEDLAFNLTSSTTVSTTPDAETESLAGFYGTYETKLLNGTNGYYGFSATSGTFKKANTNSGTNIKPFRAYFYVGQGTSARPASLGFTENGDDTPTAIESVLNAMDNGESLYDLNGHKVVTPENGKVYIMGGKKVMFK